MMYMGYDNNIDTFRNSIIFRNNLNTMSAVTEDHLDTNTLPCTTTPLGFEYNSNTEITYVFYDTKYANILREKLNIVISRDVVAEFENDYDVIGALYMKELEQVFGVHGIDELCKRHSEMLDSDMDLIASFSTCLDLASTKAALPMFTVVLPTLLDTADTKDDADIINSFNHNKRRATFSILFSYDLFFFTHLCLRDLFSTGDIKPLHLEMLCDAIREYI